MKSYFYILILLFAFPLWSQNSQKTITAWKGTQKIHIDGKLDESAWSSAEKVTGFTQTTPNPAAQPTQQTIVQLAYDDDAIYIAARCLDAGKNVSRILSLRDDFNANIDNFQVILDTYNDDQNGFVFGVSSMGVQYDSKIYQGEESPELNMVWNSAVEITETGWQVEIRIPYSAFRFPKVETQNWGINFSRYISPNREVSYWNPVVPDFNNIVAQCGELKGISGIKPPLRLALMPYVSGYADHYPYNSPGTSNWAQTFNGGMDVKLGLNEAFTLDMTLVPDFGQVVFDNQVLNLSPFEIQFNENRQFFTEGTELFNKADLFYSRRIGIQAPQSVLSTLLDSNERLSDVPQSSQLYNASKISGRTSSGLGVGVFNAITAPQTAKAININDNSSRDILVSPLTNYNVLVLDQNLKNNSSLTFTNTNVLRSGSFYDANVIGLDSKINTKNNVFYVSPWINVSSKFAETGRSFGHTLGTAIGKQTGNFIYNTSYWEQSDTWDPNDLGFNPVNNMRGISQLLSYRIFTPFGRINRMSITLDGSYNRLYNPNVYTSTYTNLSFFLNTKKFHAAGASINASITPSYDYFEPRSWGSYFIRPIWFTNNAWISSNYQKRFAIDANVNWVYILRDDWKEWGYGISPRVRVSNRLFVIYEWENNFSFGGQGYAVPFGTPAMTSSEIVFGKRDRIDVINTINLRYTLTNLMGFTFRLRHYRSAVKYEEFYDLQQDGTLVKNNLDGLDANGISAYNTNFNAFTIDFVYRWVFRPGSEINVVWKNSIFTNDKRVAETYLQNVQSTFENGALNSISVKVLYWLDYQDIKKAFKKIKE
jgi:hypothetical protein